MNIESIESKVALKERPEVGHADKSAQRIEADREKKATAEKPEMSEEILIEEINIDGMCGVY